MDFVLVTVTSRGALDCVFPTTKAVYHEGIEEPEGEQNCDSSCLRQDQDYLHELHALHGEGPLRFVRMSIPGEVVALHIPLPPAKRTVTFRTLVFQASQDLCRQRL